MQEVQKSDRIARAMGMVVPCRLEQGKHDGLDVRNDLVRLLGREVGHSGGLGRDLGILGVGRPAGPLSEAVSLPR